MNSEQALNGAILMNPTILPNVRAEISPSHFQDEKSRVVYTAFLQLSAAGNPIDVVSVSNEIAKSGMDTAYLSETLQVVNTSAGYAYHVQEIKTKWSRRKLLELAANIEQNISTREPSDLIAATRKYLMELGRRTNRREFHSLKDILPGVYRGMEDAQGRGGLSGVTTGFPMVDKYTGGWQPGELIIVAGRPGMGKSVLAKDFAERAGVPTLYFSLEMSKAELTKRQLSGHSRVNFEEIRTSRISGDHWERIVEAMDILSTIDIRYNDDADISIEEISALTESQAMDQEIGLVVIDYLQLIKGDSGDGREREIAEMSRRLKVLARALSVPVICLSQLNRSCESRVNKRPLLSDLRESGAIEQDADIVMFLYRDSVYNRSADKGAAELIISKGRNIRTGTIDLFFDGAHQTFKTVSKSDEWEGVY